MIFKANLMIFPIKRRGDSHVTSRAENKKNETTLTITSYRLILNACTLEPGFQYRPGGMREAIE